MKASLWISSIFILILIGYFTYNYFIMRNVTTPNYTVLKRDSAIEIRQYPKLLLAEVHVKGKRDEAINKGFRPLANFIFGENTSQQGSEKINMTAPVLQYRSVDLPMTQPVMQTETDQHHHIWTIQFIMPKHFTLANLPKPKNPDINIIEQPAQQVITIRFTGRVTNEAIQREMKILEAYIKKHQLHTIGQPIFAFYNPPWVLPFMRRNEIIWEIKAR